MNCITKEKKMSKLSMKYKIKLLELAIKEIRGAKC